jgi:hypothetical protein
MAWEVRSVKATLLVCNQLKYYPEKVFNMASDLLSDILLYKNKAIIARYQEEYKASPEEAAEIFQEWLKYMYLCKLHIVKNITSFQCAIYADIKKIDDMWHTFILFTREYDLFCQKYIGHFVHHAPNIDHEEKTSEAELRQELTEYFNFIYDHLGEETLITWFDSGKYA